MVEVFSDMPRGEFIALEVLEGFHTAHPEAKGMYVSDLAHKLHVSPPAVSRMLRSLEGKGYIERIVDLNDRRNIFIRLTREGSRVRDDKKREFIAFMEQVFARMGEENTRQLLALWDQLIVAMETQAKENR